MNRPCKNATRETPKRIGEPLSAAGREGPKSFDGTENLGEKSCAAVGAKKVLGPAMSPSTAMRYKG